jgi:hypothetical protein
MGMTEVMELAPPPGFWKLMVQVRVCLPATTVGTEEESPAKKIPLGAESAKSNSWL